MTNLFVSSADWLSLVCYAGAFLGSVYALAAAAIARRFLGATVAPPSSFPAVTILKPLHGAEPELSANLASFCVQDYPSPVQIIFGVADAADAAAATVGELIAAFPHCDLHLVVDARQHGANRKVSNLINMSVAARHDVLVISDSDIAVERDYLKTIAASLGRTDVGVVTLAYRGRAATGLWARYAAAAINYHFLPSVLVGLALHLAQPCFGSTVAIRRDTLNAIGGFAAVADALADDYALGARARAAGLAVAIPPTVVVHVCAERSLRELLHHELRWARTIRAVDPAGFAGSVVTHPLPLALLGLLLGGFTPAAWLVPAALTCRAILQLSVDRAFRGGAGFFWPGPLRDLLSFAVFVASFCGGAVEWRGHRYSMQSANTVVYSGKAEP